MSLEFEHNLIHDYKTFDATNLFMCKFLNLRGSSIVYFDIRVMFSLLYVDIRDSKILKIDFRKCS